MIAKDPYNTLKDRFIENVLLTKDVDYADRASVRRHNRAVTCYRKIAQDISEQYPDNIEDFGLLLHSEEQNIRICCAVCIVELMNATNEQKQNAIETIKSEIPNMDSVNQFGFEMWLKKTGK